MKSLNEISHVITGLAIATGIGFITVFYLINAESIDTGRLIIIAAGGTGLALFSVSRALYAFTSTFAAAVQLASMIIVGFAVGAYVVVETDAAVWVKIVALTAITVIFTMATRHKWQELRPTKPTPPPPIPNTTLLPEHKRIKPPSGAAPKPPASPAEQ